MRPSGDRASLVCSSDVRYLGAGLLRIGYNYIPNTTTAILSECELRKLRGPAISTPGEIVGNPNSDMSIPAVAFRSRHPSLHGHAKGNHFRKNTDRLGAAQSGGYLDFY